MTVETKTPGPMETSDGILRLLVEYAGKVGHLLERVEAARGSTVNAGASNVSFKTTPAGLSAGNQWRRLHSGLRNLINAASQLAENGAITDLQQIEMKVRLAELESLMAAVEPLIKSEP